MADVVDAQARLGLVDKQIDKLRKDCSDVGKALRVAEKERIELLVALSRRK